MRFYLLTLIALVAISSSYVVRVQSEGGLLGKITDKVGDVVGIGDDDKKDGKKESLYEGGLKQQIAHTIVDATFDRALEYGKENAPSPIIKPLLSMGGKSLKKKAHMKINAMDDEEEAAKAKAKAEAENKGKEIGGDVEGASDLVKENKRDDDDGDDDEEKKKKKKGGLKGLLGIGDRRKREVTNENSPKEAKERGSEKKQSKGLTGHIASGVAGSANLVANGVAAGVNTVASGTKAVVDTTKNVAGGAKDILVGKKTDDLKERYSDSYNKSKKSITSHQASRN